jgi:aarF domain-containing kinase
MKKKPLLSAAGPRALKLLGMAGKLASRELGQNARESLGRAFASVGASASYDRAKVRIEQAKIIAESLSHLKGAAMKAGQLLSLDAGDYFPPEAVEILTRLQAQAEPAPYAQIRQVIDEDLGASAERLAMLDPVPAAAASIGQVHSAFVDGRKVAVKVQYPGIIESMDSDLAILRKLSGALLAVSGRKIDLDPLFSEFRVVLEAEADYLRERDCLSEYGRLLGAREQFAIPEPLPELCSRRVLTMSWEDGLRAVDWVATHPPAALRAEFARRLLDLYCDEFFRWGFVQTDPNFGNYLVRERPFQVVLLDFGATIRYAPEFRASYIELVRAFRAEGRDQVFDRAVAFGLLDAREGVEARELFYQLMANALEPFAVSRQPFAFQDPDYLARARQVTMRFAACLKYSPPPRQIIFLHRKLGGLFALFKRLDVRLDLVPYWERMIASEAPLQLP